MPFSQPWNGRREYMLGSSCEACRILCMFLTEKLNGRW